MTSAAEEPEDENYFALDSFPSKASKVAPVRARSAAGRQWVWVGWVGWVVPVFGGLNGSFEKGS
jgi:hypothetical protein